MWDSGSSPHNFQTRVFDTWDLITVTYKDFGSLWNKCTYYGKIQRIKILLVSALVCTWGLRANFGVGYAPARTQVFTEVISVKAPVFPKHKKSQMHECYPFPSRPSGTTSTAIFVHWEISKPPATEQNAMLMARQGCWVQSPLGDAFN